MKFIAVGLLFVFLSVEVSCRVVPAWSNSTKDVDATKRSLPPLIYRNARIVAGYLQTTVPSLMQLGYQPQNGFYYMAPQIIKTAEDFGTTQNLWFNSDLAYKVLIGEKKGLPQLIGQPAWLPDSNSNLAIAGPPPTNTGKKEKNNFGHSEHKLIVASPAMWEAYLRLNEQQAPPGVVLGTRRDPCCAPKNGQRSTYCTQDYITHVSEMRKKYKLQDTEFMAYIHCQPDENSRFYGEWVRSQKLFQDNGIGILDPC